jgi:hypothetical protein
VFQRIGFFICRKDVMDSTTQREPRNGSPGEEVKPSVKTNTPSTPPLLPLAPKLMLLFWMLLGAVAGITLAQQVWRIVGLSAGIFAIAVPIGVVGGAVGGGLVGRITRPHLVVLVMALFAGWSVGAMGGGLAWAETGQIGGGFLGALAGGLIWAVWWWRERRVEKKLRTCGARSQLT